MNTNRKSIFNDLIDEMFEFHNHNSLTFSKTSVSKTDDGLAVSILLPGFNKDEVKVSTQDDELIIEANTEREFPKFLSKNVKKTYVLQDVDTDNVSASLENGILTILLKNKKKTKGRTISIL